MNANPSTTHMARSTKKLQSSYFRMESFRFRRRMIRLIRNIFDCVELNYTWSRCYSYIFWCATLFASSFATKWFRRLIFVLCSELLVFFCFSVTIVTYLRWFDLNKILFDLRKNVFSNFYEMKTECSVYAFGKRII